MAANDANYDDHGAPREWPLPPPASNKVEFWRGFVWGYAAYDGPSWPHRSQKTFLEAYEIPFQNKAFVDLLAGSKKNKKSPEDLNNEEMSGFLHGARAAAACKAVPEPRNKATFLGALHALEKVLRKEQLEPLLDELRRAEMAEMPSTSSAPPHNIGRTEGGQLEAACAPAGPHLQTSMTASASVQRKRVRTPQGLASRGDQSEDLELNFGNMTIQDPPHAIFKDALMSGKWAEAIRKLEVVENPDVDCQMYLAECIMRNPNSGLQQLYQAQEFYEAALEEHDSTESILISSSLAVVLCRLRQMHPRDSISEMLEEFRVEDRVNHTESLVEAALQTYRFDHHPMSRGQALVELGKELCFLRRPEQAVHVIRALEKEQTSARAETFPSRALDMLRAQVAMCRAETQLSWNDSAASLFEDAVSHLDCSVNDTRNLQFQYGDWRMSCIGVADLLCRKRDARLDPAVQDPAGLNPPSRSVSDVLCKIIGCEPVVSGSKPLQGFPFCRKGADPRFTAVLLALTDENLRFVRI